MVMIVIIVKQNYQSIFPRHHSSSAIHDFKVQTESSYTSRTTVSSQERNTHTKSGLMPWSSSFDADSHGRYLHSIWISTTYTSTLMESSLKKHHWKFSFGTIYNITSVHGFRNMAASVWTAYSQCSGKKNKCDVSVSNDLEQRSYSIIYSACCIGSSGEPTSYPCEGYKRGTGFLTFHFVGHSLDGNGHLTMVFLAHKRSLCPFTC